MPLFWLSFIDPKRPTGERFLGACIVQADDFTDAIQESWRERCNPGGEVAGWSFDPDSDEGRALLADYPTNTLLSRERLRANGERSIGERAEKRQ